MDPLNLQALEKAVAAFGPVTHDGIDHFIELLHGVLNRLDGTTVTIIEGGIKITIPPAIGGLPGAHK